MLCSLTPVLFEELSLREGQYTVDGIKVFALMVREIQDISDLGPRREIEKLTSKLETSNLEAVFHSKGYKCKNLENYILDIKRGDWVRTR